MKLFLTPMALACAAVLSATAVANAQSGRHSQQSRQYQQGYYDYNSWASRHATSPADRTGAGNFKNLTPPAGGAGRVNSKTQN